MNESTNQMRIYELYANLPIKKWCRYCCSRHSHPHSPDSHRGRGFTLLFAVLIGSLLFTVGVAIANLAVKELALSAAGMASEEAFYAADTGTECALYWDLRVTGVFPKSAFDAKNAKSSIKCNSANVDLSHDSVEDDAATTTFSIMLGSGCAEVTVGKTRSGRTIIESRGRNDCGTNDNPGRVERALRVRY